MKRHRVSIAGLMAAVAVVAVNAAVVRSIYGGGSFSQPAFFYAHGVFPLASVLITVGLISAPSLLRGERLSPFVFGFEAVGWLVVFAFISWYSIAMDAVMGCAEAIVALIRPPLIVWVERIPSWAQTCVELGFETVVFSLPQLLLALLGGTLARRLQLTIRFERMGPK